MAFAAHLTKALDATPQPEFLASPVALGAHVKPLLDFLYTARPTAVNLGAATKRLSNTLRAGVNGGKDARAIAQDLVAEGKAIDDEDVSRNKAMSKWGGEWLVERLKGQGKSAEGLSLITVCNTGSLATSVGFTGKTPI